MHEVQVRETEAKRYIDQLEQELGQLQLRRAWQPDWPGAVVGALVGGLSAAFPQLLQLVRGQGNWQLLPLPALAGAVVLGYAGRWWWNLLQTRAFAELLEVSRKNLLEHELMLLCMQSELPAKYEHLRYVAQSYGKTRERNWAELRPHSMRDRLHWLTRNYRAICAKLGYPFTLPWLQRLKHGMTALLLLPFLMMCALILLAAITGQIERAWFPQLILLCIALQMTVSFVLSYLLMAVQRLERLAVIAVLVKELDQD